MQRTQLLLITLTLGCAGTSSNSTDDGASSDGDGSSSAEAGPTTMSSTVDPSSDDGTPASTGDEGTSSAATTSGTAEDTSSGSDSADESSSGGPTSDCSNEKAPCVLELGVTASGAGGVDQFYVYEVGAGDELVQFSGSSGDYAGWFDAPGSYACNAMGPCCLSDGTTCEKPLVMEFFELGPGDTAYFIVYSNAPYELTITAG